MHPDILTLACGLYHTSPDKLVPLSGGHYNAVYQFPHLKSSYASETCEVQVEEAILRIGREDCTPGQTLAMLEWTRHLAQHGAPVSTPLPSINDQLMENLDFEGTRYTITAFRKAEGVLAEDIPVAERTPGLFQSIGRAAGRFHRVSAGYHPGDRLERRPHWHESTEIVRALVKLQRIQLPTAEKLTRLVMQLKSLPADHGSYGLIHNDLHFANFLIQPGGQVTIIDFDDCAYGWFAMDIAMALFDVLVLYNPAGEEDACRFARLFMSNYLAGYQGEYQLQPHWRDVLPRFLKLKEICVYASLIDHPDASTPGSWVGNFMRDRSSRIAAEMAYVELDTACF